MPVWFREPLHKTGCHSERSLRSEASRKKIMKINDAEFFAALGMTELAFFRDWHARLHRSRGRIDIDRSPKWEV
jgi:hypothetical protein